MDQVFWVTVMALCFCVLAVDFSLRAIEADRRSGKPDDPYRLDRFRHGEPPDPDEHP